jgi:hypothetical protein
MIGGVQGHGRWGTGLQQPTGAGARTCHRLGVFGIHGGGRMGDALAEQRLAGRQVRRGGAAGAQDQFGPMAEFEGQSAGMGFIGEARRWHQPAIGDHDGVTIAQNAIAAEQHALALAGRAIGLHGDQHVMGQLPAAVEIDRFAAAQRQRIEAFMHALDLGRKLAAGFALVAAQGAANAGQFDQQLHLQARIARDMHAVIVELLIEQRIELFDIFVDIDLVTLLAEFGADEGNSGKQGVGGVSRQPAADL